MTIRKDVVLGSTALCLALSGGVARSALTLQASYGLGESGTVGATSPYTPLYDSTGNGHNITGTSANSSEATIIAASPNVPGSTSALRLNNSVSMNTSGAYFFNAVPFSLNNNFAFEIYVRPDTGGTIMLQTDNNGTNGVSVTTGISVWAHGSAAAGPNSGLGFGSGAGGTANATAGITYSLNTWYRADIIRYNGSNYCYLGPAGGSEQQVATAGDLTNFSATLSQPILGAGQGVNYNTSGAFDSLKVYTFDPATDSMQSVTDGIGVTPEPSSIALIGIGGLGMFARRRGRPAIA